MTDWCITWCTANKNRSTKKPFLLNLSGDDCNTIIINNDKAILTAACIAQSYEHQHIEQYCENNNIDINFNQQENNVNIVNDNDDINIELNGNNNNNQNNNNNDRNENRNDNNNFNNFGFNDNILYEGWGNFKNENNIANVNYIPSLLIAQHCSFMRQWRRVMSLMFCSKIEDENEIDDFILIARNATWAAYHNLDLLVSSLVT